MRRARVFGALTSISGRRDYRCPFARNGDVTLATSTVEGVLDLMESFPELNEFKHSAALRWRARPALSTPSIRAITRGATSWPSRRGYRVKRRSLLAFV